MGSRLDDGFDCSDFHGSLQMTIVRSGGSIFVESLVLKDWEDLAWYDLYWRKMLGPWNEVSLKRRRKVVEAAL